MKRIYTILIAAAALLTACEEFQPVFTGKYENPEEQYIYTDEDFVGSEIKQFVDIEVLKSRYGPGPTKVEAKWITKIDDGDGNPDNDVTYRQKYGAKCIIFAPVSCICPLPAPATVIQVPLACAPFKMQAGYFILVFEPTLPSIHSINPFSSTIARFVTKL